MDSGKTVRACNNLCIVRSPTPASALPGVGWGQGCVCVFLPAFFSTHPMRRAPHSTRSEVTYVKYGRTSKLPI